MTMRRADSEMQEKIEEMIQGEADPRERARLLVQLQMLKILVDTVGAVQGLSTRVDQHTQNFDSHVRNEEQIINQGKGVWRILAGVLLVAQGSLGYLYVEHIELLKGMQATLATHGKQLEVINERHRIEERLGRQP